MRPKKPCPKCQINKVAGMTFCNRCGAELSLLKGSEMIDAMLNPDAYVPELAPAETPAPASAKPPTERPQLIVMAADRPEDGPAEADIPSIEVDPPAVETAMAENSADQAAPTATSPAPNDGDDQAAPPADQAATDEGSDVPFDEDAVTEEIEVKPPVTRDWRNYATIILAIIACGTLIALIFYYLIGPLGSAVSKSKPSPTKHVGPTKAKLAKPAAKTPTKTVEPTAKTDANKAKPASGGLSLGPATVTRGQPGTVQLDLSNCGPGSVTVKGNKVLLKDCAKAIEPTEPPPPADGAERERIRVQTDSLRILRQIRKAKPGPGLTGPTGWPADNPPAGLTPGNPY